MFHSTSPVLRALRWPYIIETVSPGVGEGDSELNGCYSTGEARQPQLRCLVDANDDAPGLADGGR